MNVSIRPLVCIVHAVLLDYCVHCSKVCVSVFCSSSSSSSSRNLCVFLPSGRGVVARPRQQQESRPGSGLKAGKQQQLRKGSRCAQHCTHWSLSICPSICIAAFQGNWIASECWLSSFLCHRCSPTTPDLPYFWAAFII